MENSKTRGPLFGYRVLDLALTTIDHAFPARTDAPAPAKPAGEQPSSQELSEERTHG